MANVVVGPLPSRWEEALPGLLDLALPCEALTVHRFIQQVLIDPNVQPENLIGATVDGRLVGFCVAIVRRIPLEDAPDDSDRGYVTLFAVHPDFRRQGVGAALLGAAEALFRAKGCTKAMISPYSPGYFFPGVDVNAYPGGIAFLERLGYVVATRPVAMQTDLWNLTTPDWVEEKRRKFASEGGAVEPWRPGLTLPLLDFARQEFGGDWLRWVRDGIRDICDGDRADRLIVAHDATGVLGFSHYKAERFGPIGVGKAQRGRGLGHVMLFDTLHAQRRAGARVAWFLWSDDNTAERLYNVAGFVEARRFALMKKELN